MCLESIVGSYVLLGLAQFVFLMIFTLIFDSKRFFMFKVYEFFTIFWVMALFWPFAWYEFSKNKSRYTSGPQ